MLDISADVAPPKPVRLAEYRPPAKVNEMQKLVPHGPPLAL
jgi:hypothetical protein